MMVWGDTNVHNSDTTKLSPESLSAHVWHNWLVIVSVLSSPMLEDHTSGNIGTVSSSPMLVDCKHTATETRKQLGSIPNPSSPKTIAQAKPPNSQTAWLPDYRMAGSQTTIVYTYSFRKLQNIYIHGLPIHAYKPGYRSFGSLLYWQTTSVWEYSCHAMSNSRSTYVYPNVT